MSRPRPTNPFPPRRATLSLPTPPKPPLSTTKPQITKPPPPTLTLSLPPFLHSLPAHLSTLSTQLSTLPSHFQTLLSHLKSLKTKFISLPVLHKRLLLFATIFFLFLIYLVTRPPPPPLSHSQIRELSHSISKQPGNTRARALATALKSWKYGPPPANVIVTAAACDERDAMDAIFQLYAPHARAARRYGVVDIGAGRGLPLTKHALQMGAGWVVAVEAVDGLFWRLKTLHRNGGKLIAVRGVGGRKGGTIKMGFRGDVGCLGGCVKGVGVRVEEVVVYGIDEMMEGREEEGVDGRDVLMVRVVGYGKEGDILEGGRDLLESGRVSSLVVRVDGRGGRDGVLGVVKAVLVGGLKCVGLRSEGGGRRGWEVFGEGVGWRTGETFWRFVNATGGVGELFCVKRPG